MSFGTRLKESRELKGFKQNQFAELLGITATRLNYWEKDKREPDVAMIKKISALLDVSSDWLIGNETQKNVDEIALETPEKKIIKKYRSLDKYGQKAITDLLNTEYERCTQENNVIDLTIELPMSELPASAGTGIWLEEGYNKPVTVRKTKEAQKANIVIRVSGDSMEPLYSDGDMVLVKIQPDIEPGEIGIFIVDNEGFIKKRGKHELISVNPEYDNIEIGEFSDCRCFGKVLGKAEVVE